MKREYIKPEMTETKFQTVENITLSMPTDGTGVENDVEDPYD